MSNLIKIIKSFKIKRILTVFLVGCLLTFSTACSQDSIAQTKNKAGMEAAKVMSDTYDDYDANQDFKGGMNGYNDDRRYNAETAAKAQELVNTAKIRQQDNVGDYVDSITDLAESQIEQAKRDIPSTLRSNKEDAVDYVQDKSDKLQRNLSKVPGGAKEVFDEATNTAQNALEDATKATEKTTKEIKSNFEDIS